MSENKEPAAAKVSVKLPKNCKRTNLSIDALDSYTRELANKTTVAIGKRPLFCRAVKIATIGGEECLVLTIRPESFRLINEESK